MFSKFKFAFLLCFLLIPVFSSCGGGGGGSSDSSDSSGRTSKTGVRIVHTSIDTVPIGLFQDGVYLTKSSYMELGSYIPVAELPSVLSVTRGSRQTDLVREMNFLPTPNTEYTLLVLGQAQDNQLDLELVSEPIGRPLKGLGRVRFLNALVGANGAKCSITDEISSVSLSSAYGVISEPIEIPLGIKNIAVIPSSGARHTQVADLPDRGEWLIILAGKNELGFSILNIVNDLD